MAAVDGTSSPAVSVDSTVDSSLKRIKLEIADLRAQNAILNRNLEKQREIDGKKCKMYDERVDYLKCHLAKQGNVLFHAQKEIARLNKAMSQMTKKAVDQSEDSADGIADEEDDGELSEIDVMESESQAENKPATDEPVFATSKCIKTYSTRQKDRPVHTGSDPGTSVKIPRKAVAPGRKRNYPEISGAGLHTRKRNGEKRFRCPVAFCGRSYFQSCTLQRHIRVNHHGARPFSCEFAFCSRRYSCRSELQRHIKSHSGDRPFKCDYGSCWRRFATGGELERHKRVHDRYKLFKCPWENCGQKFLQRFRFAEHMSRHTGEQRFQCPVKGCSKRFLEDRLLHIHQAAHFRDLYPISDAGEGDNGVFEDIPPQSMCEAQIKTEPEDYDEEMGSDTEAEANLLGRVFNLPDAGRSNPQETSIGVETEDRDDGDGEEANPGIERVPRIKVEPEEYEEPESDDGRDMESSGDVSNCLGGIGGKVYREESQRTGAETLEGLQCLSENGSSDDQGSNDCIGIGDDSDEDYIPLSPHSSESGSEAVPKNPAQCGYPQASIQGRGHDADILRRACQSYALPVGSREVAQDGTVWEVVDTGDNEQGGLAQGALEVIAGPTVYARENVEGDKRVSKTWRLLIDEPMLRHIKMCTEAEARRQLKNAIWSISPEELEAFIAVLYARGIYCARGVGLDNLWSLNWGIPFFRRTFSRDRFREIMRFLRFDLKKTRCQRLQTDKFALSSVVWNRFVENSILCYRPGRYVTVDSQLLPTKTRCKFTQYMANKPGKFGIKFWLAVDASTKYFLNGFPHLGVGDRVCAPESLSENVVLRLLKPYLNEGRNVTTGNSLTSLELVETLQGVNTTLVGVVNRSRREVPPSMKTSQARLHSATIVKHSDTTLTVYQGKKHDNVLLLSSLHQSVEVGTDRKGVPNTVAFYNSTKSAVDVLDQMAKKYSVKAASRSWPVQVFYNILDLAAINAWILFKEVMGKEIGRREFVRRLVDELGEEYTRARRAREAVETRPANGKRRLCHVAKCHNKTHDICTTCRLPICGRCTEAIERRCVNCLP